VIRIAATGDVHFGHDSAGTLRPHLEELSDCADVLLLAGDLTRVGAVEEAEMLARELDGLDVPVVGVLGNHDHHGGAADGIRAAMERAGVCMLDGDATALDVGEQRLKIIGAKGFGGGFAGASGTAFGEPEMKAFIERTEAEAGAIEQALADDGADSRVVLLHYSPVKDTVVGERLEIYPFLGSYLLARAVDAHGADLVVHGHAHAGAEKGLTPGGVRVRNVAMPVIRQSYRVFCLEPEATADAAHAA
jgi:Icc-related predicted phosphoesterase